MMEVEIVKSIIKNLSCLPKEIIVVILSMIPIGEIRLGLPVGFWLMKFNIVKAFLLSLLGNTLFIAPVLFFLEPVSRYLMRFKWGKKFFDWNFSRTKKKASLIERYEFWGLMIFVGIPLPMTGAWTGCIAASLFKMKFRYAFLANVLGVIIAGIIVAILCVSGKMILSI
ncbi:MAG: small multi-drug export protein [Candidatus Omnitrophota bacterium]|nr:small multi-drug export protein [Candidatus Omnitrophota bacterium]